VAIETLSDDVLFGIFDLCLDKDEDIDPWYDLGDEEDERYPYDAWYVLAHVCQRWRYVVFASPRRLKSATSLLKKTCKGDVGCLASVPYRYLGHLGLHIGRRHRCT